jgi:hypothetical protein
MMTIMVFVVGQVSVMPKITCSLCIVEASPVDSIIDEHCHG